MTGLARTLWIGVVGAACATFAGEFRPRVSLWVDGANSAPGTAR